MRKYIKWGLLVAVVVGVLSTNKISITINSNEAEASTFTNMTIEDADRLLEDSMNIKSVSTATREAQIANAVYSKEIYKLLKEKENK